MTTAVALLDLLGSARFRVPDLKVITSGVDELKMVFSEIRKLQQLERMQLTQRTTGMVSFRVRQFELWSEYIGLNPCDRGNRACSPKNNLYIVCKWL